MNLSMPDIFTLRQIIWECGLGTIKEAQDMSREDLEQIWNDAPDLQRRRAILRSSLKRGKSYVG